MGFLKNVYLWLFCRNNIFLRLKKIGKNSYIREGAHVIGGKFVQVLDNVMIGKNSRIVCISNHMNNSYNPSLTIGNNCYIGEYLTIFCTNELIIGDNCLIASHVLISDENHGLDINIDYSQTCLISKRVEIGEGCWIGEKVCILPGVKIGKKCVIGAASVVTKDVPDYTIVAGNPARIIKRYDFETNKWVKVK